MSTTLEERLRFIKNEKIEKIIPNNIKSGVTILNVTGNVIEANEEPNIVIDPRTSVINISPSLGYTGLASVTINPVTSQIDNNIISENIKSGIEILGVIGTYDQSIEFSQFLDLINGEVI